MARCDTKNQEMTLTQSACLSHSCYAFTSEGKIRLITDKNAKPKKISDRSSADAEKGSLPASQSDGARRRRRMIRRRMKEEEGEVNDDTLHAP